MLINYQGEKCDFTVEKSDRHHPNKINKWPPIFANYTSTGLEKKQQNDLDSNGAIQKSRTTDKMQWEQSITSRIFSPKMCYHKNKLRFRVITNAAK